MKIMNIIDYAADLKTALFQNKKTTFINLPFNNWQVKHHVGKAFQPKDRAWRCFSGNRGNRNRTFCSNRKN